MFSRFFKPKPAPEQERQYVRQANQITQMFGYCTIKGEFPPEEGQTDLSIKNESNRTLIKNEVIRLIEAYQLKNLSLEVKTQAFEAMIQKPNKKQAEDAAGLIIISLNSLNMIASHYYECFPSYKPLLEMLNNLTKIVMPVLDEVFEGQLPDNLQNLFPRVEGLFKDYKNAMMF